MPNKNNNNNNNNSICLKVFMVARFSYQNGEQLLLAFATYHIINDIGYKVKWLDLKKKQN